MGPYSRWVHQSFKQTLLDHCDEYLDTTDRGGDKTRTKLIARVANNIASIAQEKEVPLPDDLEKVNCHDTFIWICWLTFSGRPYLVWELCIWKCEGGQARKIEVGYTGPSHINEVMDRQVGLWPDLRG